MFSPKVKNRVTLIMLVLYIAISTVSFFHFHQTDLGIKSENISTGNSKGHYTEFGNLNCPIVQITKISEVSHQQRFFHSDIIQFNTVIEYTFTNVNPRPAYKEKSLRSPPEKIELA